MKKIGYRGKISLLSNFIIRNTPDQEILFEQAIENPTEKKSSVSSTEHNDANKVEECEYNKESSSKKDT